MISLKVHAAAGPAHGQHFIPSADQLAKVVEDVSKCFPPVPFMNEPTDHFLISEIERFIAGSAINWEGGPGYPFASAHKDNRSLIEHDYVSFVLCVLSVLQAWRDTPFEEVQKMTSVEHFEKGLYYPVRMFIKSEPHSAKKMAASRWRLVMSEAGVVSAAYGVLCQAYNDVLIQNHASTFVKTGMGHSHHGIAETWSWAQNLASVAPAMCSNDVSWWDWRTPYWLIRAESEVVIRVRSASPLWANMIRISDHCQSTVILADRKSVV